MITVPKGFSFVYQTDKEFEVYPNIRHGACYALSWFTALCIKFRLPYGHKEFLSFFEEELGDGDKDVDNELFIGDPQNYIDDLVGRGKVTYVGWRSAAYEAPEGSIEIGCWHRFGTSFNHFVLHDNGKVFYDPWGVKGSDSVHYGTLIGKRIALIR